MRTCRYASGLVQEFADNRACPLTDSSGSPLVDETYDGGLFAGIGSGELTTGAVIAIVVLLLILGSTSRRY